MKIARVFVHIALVVLLICSGQKALAIDIGRPEVKQFINSMVSKHHYSRRALKRVLREAKSQESILEAISKPAEKTKPWDEYRAILLIAS